MLLDLSAKAVREALEPPGILTCFEAYAARVISDLILRKFVVVAQQSLDVLVEARAVLQR